MTHTVPKETSISQLAQNKQFPAMLEKYKNEIAKALPKHLNGDRMARVALTAFRRNPKLGNCDPRSVFACVLQSAQLGLEIDTLGQAYLIPYDKRQFVNGKWQTVGTECQFVPGWKGLVELANRSGKVSVWTGAVFNGDVFDYQLGDSPFIHHKPMGEDEIAMITHVYAVGRIKGSEWPVVEVWPIERVWKHRNKYNKVGEKHYSYGNEEMYARKVVLLQILKYLPSSPELNQATELSNAAENGEQHLNVKDAIDGTWALVQEEDHDYSDNGERVQQQDDASGVFDQQR